MWQNMYFICEYDQFCMVTFFNLVWPSPINEEIKKREEHIHPYYLNVQDAQAPP